MTNGYTKTYPSGWTSTSATQFTAAFGTALENALANCTFRVDTYDGTIPVISATRTGDNYPFLLINPADYTFKLLDGQTDPATVTADGSVLVVRGQPNQNTMQVQAATDSSIHTIFQITDHLGSLITWFNNVGGISHNDNFQLTRSVYGPINYYADIYGYVAQHGSMYRRWVGPPGNAFDHATATGENFQGNRSGSPGTWHGIFGATGVLGVPNPYGGVINPAESFYVLQFTQLTGSTAAVITGETSALNVDCVTGNYAKAFISLRAAATTRTWIPTLQFYDASGNYLPGYDITGASVSVTSAAWVQLTVGGIAPPLAGGVALKLQAAGVSTGEIIYGSAAGMWVDNSVVTALDANPQNVWNPPFVGQNDGSGYNCAVNGDEHTRLDNGATSGNRIYVLDAQPGFWYPNQIGAPGSDFQPRWVLVGDSGSGLASNGWPDTDNLPAQTAATTPPGVGSGQFWIQTY